MKKSIEWYNLDIKKGKDILSSENYEELIEKAVRDFETLLKEQLKRGLQLEKENLKEIEKELEESDLEDSESSYKSKNIDNLDKNYPITIGLIDGDGIGPIIMKSAKKVLENILSDEISEKKVILKEIKGLTIENRMKNGESVPNDILKEIKTCDYILKGPTETPKGGKLESANVTLRRELDLYANIRPIKVPEKNIDWVFFRENTEGEYVLGSRGIEIDGILAMDFKVTTNAGTYRIAKKAFDYAAKNQKTSLAVVTKANIMKKTDGNFSSICRELGKNYPQIEVRDYYIDIMAANLVNENIRSDFQVFVLPNLYGDILTDEAAEIQGGVGTAGSINLGDRYAMFEAVHGTAPKLIEDGLAEYANPKSILKSLEMMLEYMGYELKAKKLEIAIEKAEKSKEYEEAFDKNGIRAKSYTELIIKNL